MKKQIITVILSVLLTWSVFNFVENRTERTYRRSITEKCIVVCKPEDIADALDFIGLDVEIKSLADDGMVTVIGTHSSFGIDTVKFIQNAFLEVTGNALPFTPIDSSSLVFNNTVLNNE